MGKIQLEMMSVTRQIRFLEGADDSKDLKYIQFSG